MTPAQLPLNLPHRTALGREDFLVADANRAAVAFIDLWPNWPAPTAVLVGPAGAGKTHLGEVWRLASGAVVARAETLSAADVPTLAEGRAVLLENIDQLPRTVEPALFHLINQIKEVGGHLLMTSRLAPARLEIALPDLSSRLRAAIVAELGLPDDVLLRSVLEKLFTDRQLAAPEAAIAYLAAHMDRSIATARTLVAAIDSASLAGKRRVTVPLVAEILRQNTPQNSATS